jgi:PHP family Zn ribbon phosphoesterase
LLKPVDCIPIHWQFIIAVKNGNGIFFHLLYKTLAVLYKNFGIEWQILHMAIN